MEAPISLFGRTSIFAGRCPKSARRKLFEVAGSDAQFFGEEPLTGFRDDQVNSLDARVRFEQFQRFLRQDGAAGSGHTYGYGLLFVVSHLRFCSRIHSVSQRA